MILQKILTMEKKYKCFKPEKFKLKKYNLNQIKNLSVSSHTEGCHKN
jgi:hypothetical protein